jgi:peptidoglycan/LPS O-acetylase OafA/YrhL
MISVHSPAGFSRMRRLFETNWLVRIGKVSYGMYLFHWAIMVYFYKRFFPDGPVWRDVLLFIPYVVIVYLLAELSFRVYESRFLVWKEKLTASRALPAEHKAGIAEGVATVDGKTGL